MYGRTSWGIEAEAILECAINHAQEGCSQFLYDVCVVCLVNTIRDRKRLALIDQTIWSIDVKAAPAKKKPSEVRWDMFKDWRVSYLWEKVEEISGGKDSTWRAEL